MKAMSKQKGAVLIISLVLLLVMTLLGLSSMQSTSLEERMAGNERHANVAFQAAEAALRAGEGWLNGQNSAPDDAADGSSTVWTLDAPELMPATPSSSDPWWKEWDDTGWATYGTVYTGTLSLASDINLNNARPRFVIEQIGVVSDGSLTIGTQNDFGGRSFYQVTSRGTDVSGRIQVLLRSTYARRY